MDEQTDEQTDEPPDERTDEQTDERNEWQRHFLSCSLQLKIHYHHLCSSAADDAPDTPRQFSVIGSTETFLWSWDVCWLFSGDGA